MTLTDKDLNAHSTSAADEDLAKSDVEQSENNVEDIVPKPENIRHMSNAEIKNLETKMVRKLDLVIMPIMGILYILNYVDRSALAATKVYGIMEDLSMSSTDFATAISILFVGYIPMQIPSNMIITKISRPGLYICSAAIIWGAVSASTAAAKNYQALLGIRVLLGITEAVFFPGMIYYLGSWYTSKELGKRLAALFIFQMLGSAFGGLVAAACLTLDGRYGLAGWRWLFIVEGVVTIGCGIIFSFIMPEYPHNARLLSAEERSLAVWRLESEKGDAVHDETSTLKGVWLGITDYKVLALVWCMGMSQAMGSTVNFFPSIVQTLGYGRIETMLMTAPPYVLAAIIFYCVSYISDRKNTMYPIIASSLAVAVVAYVITIATLNTGPRYFAMMLMPTVCTAPQIMLYKTTNLHMAHPQSKRAASVAMLNSIGGLSNVWASYLYGGAPHYYAAFGTLLGCVIAFFITITGYLIHMRRLNKLLAGTPEEQRLAIKSGVTQQQIDLGWRYIGY